MNPKQLDAKSVIGFIGLGNMGGPMAMRLAQRGFRLRLFDTRAEVTSAIAEATGGDAVGNLSEFGAELDGLVLMLPDGRAVRHVLIHEGIAQRMQAGSLVIDMSSSAPDGTIALGYELAALGLHMVDAPVSGGVARAKTGDLTIMAGGDLPAVESSQLLLSAMGSRIFPTGRLGTGQAMKSLNNFVSAVGLIATCEAVVAGSRFGIDPQVAAEVLNGSTGRNNTTEHKLRQFMLSGTFASGFSLDLMVKDLGIAAGVACYAGAHPVLAETCFRLWSEAQKSLGSGHDHTEMWRWVESTMNA
jgi:3-hydroxyisobutyrate dehydrogenase